MQVKPLSDRVLLKRTEAHEEVRGGIIIPDTAKEKPQEAEVIAVGDGKLDEDGKRVPMNGKAGDRVLIGRDRFRRLGVRVDQSTVFLLRWSLRQSFKGGAQSYAFPMRPRDI